MIRVMRVMVVILTGGCLAFGCAEAETGTLLRPPPPDRRDAGAPGDAETSGRRLDAAQTPDGALLDAGRPGPAPPDASEPERQSISGSTCPTARASIRTQVRYCLPPEPGFEDEALDPSQLDTQGLLLLCAMVPMPTTARLNQPRCVDLVPTRELPELSSCYLTGGGSAGTTRGRTLILGQLTFATAPRVLFRVGPPTLNGEFESYWLDAGNAAPAVSVTGHSIAGSFGASRMRDDEANLQWSTTTTPAAPINRDGLGVAEAGAVVRAVWASRPSTTDTRTSVWMASWSDGTPGFDPGTEIVARTASITHRFPQVVHDGANRVSVAWLQVCRTEPCPDSQLGIFVMSSQDGGRSFTTPSRVDALPSRLDRRPVLWMSSRGPLVIRRIAETVSGGPAELELLPVDRLDAPRARFAWPDAIATLLPLPGDRIMVVGGSHLALVEADGTVTTRVIEDGNRAELKPNGDLVRFTSEGHVRVSSDLGQTFRLVGQLQRNVGFPEDDSIASWVGDDRILYVDRRTHEFATPSLYPGESCDDFRE